MMRPRRCRRRLRCAVVWVVVACLVHVHVDALPAGARRRNIRIGSDKRLYDYEEQDYDGQAEDDDEYDGGYEDDYEHEQDEEYDGNEGDFWRHVILSSDTDNQGEDEERVIASLFTDSVADVEEEADGPSSRPEDRKGRVREQHSRRSQMAATDASEDGVDSQRPTPPTVQSNAHRHPSQPTCVRSSSKSPQLESDQQQSSASHHPTIKPTDDALVVTPWVREFIASRPQDALLPVPRDFLTDAFNLSLLPPLVERAATTDFDDVVDEDDDAHHVSSPPKIQAPPSSLQKPPVGRGGADLDALVANRRSRAAIGTVSSASAPPGPNADTKPSSLVEYPYFQAALQLLVNLPHAENQSSFASSLSSRRVQRAAEVLFVFLHARYAISPRGMETIRERMLRRRSRNHNSNNNNDDQVDPIFGRCPRVACGGMPLLPSGRSDGYSLSRHKRETPPQNRAMRYCSCCGETFHSWDSQVDGSAWGTSFCHLFLLVYGREIFPQLRRKKSHSPPTAHPNPSARIFGFRVHPTLASVKYPLQPSFRSDP